ncbi:hypothetical protein SANA_06880 [Gottschalkiaceae bacterium SANA]|nr:hypothetical protein SANA_06880 [Gottschalkiaceae bacterium SANA]
MALKKSKSLRSTISWFIIPKVIGGVALSFLIVLGIFHIQMVTYVDRFVSARNNNIEEFMEQYEETLANYARIHGHWTDLIDHIDQEDFEWIQENASQNLLQETNYDIDLVYIKDSSTGFESALGASVEGVRYLRSQVAHNVGKQEFEAGIIKIDEEPYLINGTYLSDNDGLINRGFYVVGRKIDDVFWEKLHKSMNLELVQSIWLEEDEIAILYPSFFCDTAQFCVPLNHSTTMPPIFLHLEYKLDYLYTFLYDGQVGVLILIVFGICLIILLVFRALKDFVAKLSVMQRVLHRVRNGFFGEQMEPMQIEEMDELIDAFNQMSTGLDLYQKQVSQDQVDMVHLMVKAVDINDHYTKGHSERVAIQARQLAVMVGYEHPNDIEIAGLLHDVGKISIPTQILNKPGRLTEEEYEIIKTHPERGYELLFQSEVFRVVRGAVRDHHERFDGKGYPRGLKGDEIAMEARIVSICDVYDALTSDRPYRKAMSHKEAIEVINKERGKAFSQDLVDLFLLIFENEKT